MVDAIKHPKKEKKKKRGNDKKKSIFYCKVAIQF